MASRKKDVPTKKEVPTQMKLRHAVPLTRDSQGIYSLAWSPDGQELIVGFGNGAIQAVNPADGKPSRDIFSGGVSRQATTCLCFHPKDPSHLIAVGAEGIVAVYDTKTGKCKSTITEENTNLYTVDISADGGTYATAGSNRSIKIYDTRTNQVINVLEPADYVTSGKELKPIDGHTRRIFAVRFHPEERHIFVSGGWDDSIKIWDKRMASEARKVLTGPHICGPAIDIKSSKILTGSWVAKHALQIWDFRKSTPEKNIPFREDKDHGEFIYAARFCVSDIVVAGGSGTNSVQAINYKTDTALGEIKLHAHPVHVITTMFDGQNVAFGGGGGNLHIAYLL
ncbi:vegetative incompatibility protein HET-E-1-like [Rhincodon typus]|uniref:vegetative incompatibility protein HET-E-1-like n=1 Tax=Rhincodon typus TaxID=259920 RepID=UPI0009A2BEE0|nr:vegetative incompatibility protein HET-E-1-like [Rhincodon typus]